MEVKEEEEDDDSDIDLFGDDDEDEEAERLKAERVKAYQDKKSKKPALIAKSSILLDVKPVRTVAAATCCSRWGALCWHCVV